MAMTQAQKDQLQAQILTELSRRSIPVGIVKADIATTITEIDNFIDSSLVAINNAISEPAQSTLPAALKLWIFAQVAATRNQNPE